MYGLILAHLPKDDLRIVCLANRHLCTLAEPFLYSDIHFAWKKSQHHPITSLLRSLLGRPELATHVRRVSLVGTSLATLGNQTNQPKFPKIPVSEAELKAPLAFVQKTTLPYREIWLKELRNGTMDAFVAVLLSQSLRLTYLFLDFDFFHESRFICLAFQSMIFEPQDCGLQLNLRHLETVCLGPRFDGEMDPSASSTTDILAFFYLPSLKRISACFDRPATFSWPVLHPPSPTCLRSLKLRCIREPCLRKLLSTTDQLLFLDWEWFYDPEHEDPVQTPVIDLTQITTAISSVRGTLTELVLSACCTRIDYYFPVIIQGSLRGITEFSKLTKITVPLALLMGCFEADITKRIADYLPRSLECLAITDHLALLQQYEWYDEEFFCVLQAWLDDFQTSTPLLREVKLEYEPSRTRRKRPIGIKFKALCDRVGICSEVIEPVHHFWRRNC
jgi:hypothetical protein